MWGFGWVVPVLLIVVCVFFMARTMRGPHQDRALAILRERFARGELSKEEFERMRQDLKA
jgi:putative membrane protein